MPQAQLEGAGRADRQTAVQLGLVGPKAEGLTGLQEAETGARTMSVLERCLRAISGGSVSKEPL